MHPRHAAGAQVTTPGPCRRILADAASHEEAGEVGGFIAFFACSAAFDCTASLLVLIVLVALLAFIVFFAFIAFIAFS